MSDGDQCSESSDYGLNVRSYVPFASFGGGFEGDNRGTTTARTASSRIAVKIFFNPVSGKKRKAIGIVERNGVSPAGHEGYG